MKVTRLFPIAITGFLDAAKEARGISSEIQKVGNKSVYVERGGIRMKSRLSWSLLVLGCLLILVESACASGDFLEACKRGDVKQVAIDILKGYADVDLRDANLRTPLMWAVMSGNSDVVELLLSVCSESSVNAQDVYGMTALMYAASRGNVKVVKLLLEAGADVDAHDRNGWTPLFFAAEKGYMAVMLLLIEAGAKVSTKDKYGRTFLDIALERASQSATGYRNVPSGFQLTPDTTFGGTFMTGGKSLQEIIDKIMRNGEPRFSPPPSFTIKPGDPGFSFLNPNGETRKRRKSRKKQEFEFWLRTQKDMEEFIKQFREQSKRPSFNPNNYPFSGFRPFPQLIGTDG